MNVKPINLERLREYEVVAVDIEATGLHWYRDKMFGVSLAGLRPDGQISAGYWDIRDKPRITEVLKHELKHCKRVVNHHMKFDAHFLKNEGVDVPIDRIECTMVRAALINEHSMSMSLDARAKECIGKTKMDIWPELAKLFGGAPTRAAQIKNLHRAPQALTSQYAIADSQLALELWLWQEKEIERQGLQRIWDLERKVTPILFQIERQGVRVDEAYTHEQIKNVDLLVDKAQHQLNKIAGKKINANSPVQMRAMFGTKKTMLEDGRVEWRTSTGFLLENTDGGEASLGKDSLMVMAENGDERAKHVLTLRRMLKCKQFLKDHILAHAVNGRVYPNYNQLKSDSGLGTITGRLSVDDPALQQIPMHDRDVAEIVRPAFLPEKGQEWCCADWKQFEFRWFAHYVKDPGIIEMYEKDPNADFHQATADLTGITRDRKFAGDTANAKQINLGLVFGMGEGEMAYNMGMDYTQRYDEKNKRMWKIAGDKAKAVFAKYHNAIPGVKKLLQEASSIAKARGYVQTAGGRHIRFPHGKFTHKAGGLVFQGTSADCMKLKMVELWPICKAEGWNYIVTVHDEHDLSTPPKARKKVQAKLEDVLQTFDGERCPIKCRIPIRSDIAFGKNWWAACS